MGILHHQRPGFLSYPASHSIPYLRDKKYPIDKFPEMYEYRELKPRIIKKVLRVYKRFPNINTSLFRSCKLSNVLDIELKSESIDAIITSPPYMNTLDYFRDNRLRLWFLGYNYQSKKDLQNPKNIYEFRDLMSECLNIFQNILKPGKVCVLVLGDVNRSKYIRSGDIIIDILKNFKNLKIKKIIKDDIKKAYGKVNIKNRIKGEWIIVIKKEI